MSQIKFNMIDTKSIMTTELSTYEVKVLPSNRLRITKFYQFTKCLKKKIVT